VTSYAGLWRQVEGRLNAAYGLLRADAPEVATSVEPTVRDWLEHNELGLALDTLLDVAGDARSMVRRRFWEELLVAALRMGLERQFLRIADRITDLEPPVFAPVDLHMCVYCDFNGAIESDRYSLDSVGTALDFARARRIPVSQQTLTLYDYDSADDGGPTWLMAEAVILEHEPLGLVAQVNPLSFRSTAR
jgi:hypothetical protein